MKIIFKEITVQNFLSFGNVPTKFEYKPGINAVTGNLIPNTFIRNGIGKTTLLVEAPTFLIYGKVLRNINNDEIINSTNRSQCVVSGIIQINDKIIRIQRTLGPSSLMFWEKSVKEWEINPDDWDEESATQLDSIKQTQLKLEEKIKISFTCFKNIIILNINHSKPFLEMSPPDKKSVVEDILSISIYGRMSDYAKKKHLDAKTDIQVFETELTSLTKTFNITKEQKESIVNETLKFEENKNKNIDNFNIQINSLQDKKVKYENIIKDKDYAQERLKLIEIKKDLEGKLKTTQSNISNVSNKIRMYSDVISKLDGKDECPLCHTKTCNDSIVKHILELKDNVLTLNVENESNNEQYTLLSNEQKLNNQNLLRIEENIEKVKTIKQNIDKCNFEIKLIKDNITREQNRKLEIKEVISNDEFIKLEECVKNAEDKFNNAQRDFKYNKYIRNLLGDEGVRKYVTLKVLPVLNKKVNYYLNMLGSDYSITFDSELNEKLIARNSDIRSYSSFSGGEKKRIDLALLLALMDVAKERNSIDTNILVLDEILDTSLDSVGSEAFLEHIKSTFKTNSPDKCVYIISHKKELGEEKFDNIIHLVKKNGFTSIDHII
jgi:DNA repair exonuclease SbcCD ATPase subunit